MEYADLLNKLNERLIAKRLAWETNDYHLLAGKGTTSGRMLGFLSGGYRKRETLWRLGRIIYGYCYKTYTDRGFERPYLAWVLFSPMTVFESEPERYEKILEKLQPLMENEKPGRSERKLVNALTNPVTESKYFVLPETVTDGKLVYVSTMYVFPDIQGSLTLGIIPIIVAPEVTLDIQFVPEDIL